MSDTVSKQVADKQRIAGTVIAAADHHGGEVSDGLNAKLFPEGAPEHLTVGEVIGALGACLKRSTVELRRTDIDLANEKADDPKARGARDESTEELIATVIDTRGILKSTYGDTILVSYGLVGETPRDPALLETYSASVIKLLESKPELGEPKRGRIAQSAAALAAALEEDLVSLRKALEGVSREQREYQVALTARDRAMDAWTATYSPVAGALTSLFRLAGNTELADRVRPTARRRKGQPEEQDLEENTGVPDWHEEVHA